MYYLYSYFTFNCNYTEERNHCNDNNIAKITRIFHFKLITLYCVFSLLDLKADSEISAEVATIS